MKQAAQILEDILDHTMTEEEAREWKDRIYKIISHHFWAEVNWADPWSIIKALASMGENDIVYMRNATKNTHEYIRRCMTVAKRIAGEDRVSNKPPCENINEEE